MCNKEKINENLKRRICRTVAESSPAEFPGFSGRFILNYPREKDQKVFGSVHPCGLRLFFVSRKSLIALIYYLDKD